MCRAWEALAAVWVRSVNLALCPHPGAQGRLEDVLVWQPQRLHWPVTAVGCLPAALPRSPLVFLLYRIFCFPVLKFLFKEVY